MALSIAELDYGNRTPSEFLQALLIASGVHNAYSVFDGVKDKQQIPIFDGDIVFGTDFCQFDPQSTATIDEKEFGTLNYKWAFKNCKTSLQRSYRSMLMQKGANNAETMDSQFKDWLYDHFSFLSGKHVGEVAETEIQAEITGDGAVNKTTGVAGSLEEAQDETTVISVLTTIFKGLPREMYLSHVKAAGVEENKGIGNLSIQLPFEVYQAYHLATSVESIKDQGGIAAVKAGAKPDSFMGMKVILNPNILAEKIKIADLNNFVTVVDDLADIKGIQAKYYEEISSDYLWGQFTIGFSYKISEEIYEYTLVTA